MAMCSRIIIVFVAAAAGRQCDACMRQIDQGFIVHRCRERERERERGWPGPHRIIINGGGTTHASYFCVYQKTSKFSGMCRIRISHLSYFPCSTREPQPQLAGHTLYNVDFTALIPGQDISRSSNTFAFFSTATHTGQCGVFLLCSSKR